MTLHELWMVTPQNHIFVHQHTCKKFTEELHEYTGLATEAGRTVLDIKAKHYPNYGYVLEVEIER